MMISGFLLEYSIEFKNNKSLYSMDMVITTLGVIVTMAVLSCLCCLCMKLSDLRMKCYIIEMAKQRGIMVDPDKLTTKHLESPQANETCTIMIPDVGIIF